MKRLVVVLLCALVAAFTEAAPKIQFAQPVHDFGRIRASEVVRHVFTFTNTGDSVLEIRGIRPACGCTHSKDFTRRVDPGQRGEIALEFSLAVPDQRVERTVEVQSNDPVNPSITLRLQATIWNPILWFPDAVNLTVSPYGQTSCTNRIINVTGESIALKLGDCDRKELSFALREVKAGKEWQLVTSAQTNLTLSVYGTLTLLSTMTNQPIVRHTVMARPMPDAQASTSRLEFTGTNLVFWLTNNTPGALSLTGPFVDTEGASGTIADVREGKVFRVDVTIGPEAREQLRAPLRVAIRTSSTRTPLVEVFAAERSNH